MTAPHTFNLYCDESCHLEHDHIPVMAWGAGLLPGHRRARHRRSRAGAESRAWARSGEPRAAAAWRERRIDLGNGGTPSRNVPAVKRPDA